jgi:hypothetical protein
VAARIALAVAVSSSLLVAVPSGAAPLPPGGTFRDDDGNFHEGNIEAIAAAGITTGCTGPDLYCPRGEVTRGQMAAFLDRALHPPASTVDYFTDDGGSSFEGAINRIAAAGITLGCGPKLYCPNAPITRGQMASFLVRAFGYPADGQNRFDDDNGSTHEDAINRLAGAGITNGCATRRFCPDHRVTRDQMASFLARALGLAPIIPPPRCTILPADNIWNRRVDDLPVHSRSAQYVARIGIGAEVHADFGSGIWPPGTGGPIGIPYLVVGVGQPKVAITFTSYGSESDPGPYPFPASAPIEGGSNSTGDRHSLVLDKDACKLYELYRAFPQSNGTWRAASGAVYNLRSNQLRPDTWTSADAAGLPIYPGLVRYEEVAVGVIRHAIRFTAPDTQAAHVWPARHDASDITDVRYAPMGQRFRLKASFDISGFSPAARVILQAMKTYGLILADNGSPWYISGAPDPRWDNDVLHELDVVQGSDFEAVDVSGLMVDPNSGQYSG